MTDIWAGVKSARNEPALAALAATVRGDLERLNFPAAGWVPRRTAPDGRGMLDVLVVGAGLCGQTIGFALMRDGIRNFRIVERAAIGEEGPWASYARMQILRSPKHLTGPDLGVPSLTFRSWFEAQHGVAGWQRLHKVGRLDWRDYLIWVRETVGIPVENGVAVTRLEPHRDGVRVTLAAGDRFDHVEARRVVLATGRDGAGAARRPSFPGLAAGSRGRVHHSSDAIDFAALRGRRVAVLGGGASAFDCAAMALEAAAREVILHVRRPHLPQVNKSKWTSFPGFMKGFAGLDDATRWGLYTYVFGEQVPPPWESVLRCDAHTAFSIRFNSIWRDVRPDGDGVAIDTSHGSERADGVILATGFDVDLRYRPELAGLHDTILLWEHRVSAAEAERHPECARFPYLGPAFEFMERVSGAAPGLDRIHAFNWGITLSHGALAGDIPGLRTGVDRMSEALCRAFLAEDMPALRQHLEDLDEPELKATGRYVPRAGHRP